MGIQKLTFSIPFRAPSKANSNKVAKRGAHSRQIVNDLTGTLKHLEQSFVEQALNRLTDEEVEGLPWEGPVEAHVVFFYEPTKSWPKWKIDAALHGVYRMTKTPDLENIVKFVWDSLQGALFTDDKNIWRQTLEKRYGPREEIQITLIHTEQATSKTWKDLTP